ncbi:enoyl-CoA hydratase/isomerase family protein [Luteibacter aegosomatissinici]|uniref:enoyl-CoA hydratase/isomerase family protein n=1 Tax=Luteibacter aegosomatissinici TaxID=2911539 RepID=UPI001FF7EAF6|nr:enoyl-CoA hydratase/isomerase family protein [Luteibacter aegosomatissinici]UPG94540.1 enoyl-CoA hydratase/isomerase family protein [Luteibacter aegosomatissinici]
MNRFSRTRTKLFLNARSISALLALSSLAPMVVNAADSVPAEHHEEKSQANQQISVTKISPAYWQVTFHNPPFNIFGPESIPQFEKVVAAIETDPQLKVVVFQSDVPGYFLTHYNFVPPLSASTSLPNGPSRLHPIPDMLSRISRSHVVSIAKLRGRVTGVGSELSLASDMRFAARENLQISQWEVGSAFVPGGGPMARLPRLIGRGRAMEVLLSADNFDGDTAEKYGYVNRAMPDAQLDAFVDKLARRIASFDGDTLADVKQAVNYATLPPDSELSAGWDLFIRSVQRPEAQYRINALMKRGLQTDPEVERNLNQYTEEVGKH